MVAIFMILIIDHPAGGCNHFLIFPGINNNQMIIELFGHQNPMRIHRGQPCTMHCTWFTAQCSAPRCTPWGYPASRSQPPLGTALLLPVLGIHPEDSWVVGFHHDHLGMVGGCQHFWTFFDLSDVTTTCCLTLVFTMERRGSGIPSCSSVDEQTVQTMFLYWFYQWLFCRCWGSLEFPVVPQLWTLPAAPGCGTVSGWKLGKNLVGDERQR